ncbi:helix-turn-helix domain-containing protein [Occultella gossypii]|uniref:AraC family transcriptional regulator n=1 Tax=Occultella gossypii TaxID=2800820 RepID=A0ABS7S585_9MICO|nr:helix-turn-helix domain-containing protein [Occultella gossypii]MBZ2194935.1 AraC family transcriptional regulator [Occultella gossypii]
MGLVSWREESELGTWTHLELRPAAPTVPAAPVESVWLFEGSLRRRERYYPTGTLDLLVQLDETSPTFRIVDGQSAATCPPSCLAGLLVAPLVVETPTATSRMIGVRLRPAGAASLFDVPLQELTGTAVDLHDLLGDEAGRLLARLHEPGTDAGRLRIMARWIADRLGDRAGVDQGVAYAVAAMERTGGKARVANIVERVGSSPKRFVRTFERQVGVKPKLFSRIVRFRSLVADLPRVHGSLSQAAIAHGYYDQAHMNADFHEFAGMSPRQFLAASRFPASPSVAD